MRPRVAAATVTHRGLQTSAQDEARRAPECAFMRIAALLAALAAFALLAASPVSAGYFTFEPEPDETDRAAKDYYGDFADALPEDLRSRLADGDVGDSPWSATLSETLTAIKDELVPSLGRFGVLAAVCVLCVVLCTVARCAEGSPLARAAPFLSRCAILLAVTERQIGTLGVLSGAFSRMTAVTSALVPGLCAVCAASGSVTSSALGASGFAMLCALVGDGFASLCLPSLYAILALTSVSGAFESKIAAAVARFLRTATATVCTLGMTAFIFVFNMQMSLAKSADGALYRVVRAAVSSFVPIVGGQVAEAGGQLGASFSVILASCGAIAVCAVVLLTAPMLARLVCDRASLFACRHILGAISPECGESALEDAGALCTLEIAVALSAAIGFVLCLSAFVRAATAVG